MQAAPQSAILVSRSTPKTASAKGCSMGFRAILIFLLVMMGGPQAVLAASAYKAPDPTTPPVPAPAGSTTAPAAPDSTTAPAAPDTTTTLPAATTTPAADTGTASSTETPPATDRTAAGEAAGTVPVAPAAPAASAYQPPAVEAAPGGITIYHGSGSP